MKKNILYWSPFLTNVATVKAVINSAYSLKKYGGNYYNPIIINAGGEFDLYSEQFKKKKIEVINLCNYNYINYLPKYGFLRSRFSFFVIFFKSFFPLLKILKNYNSKNDYLIVHLISLLPLILSFFFKFELKFILRVSGYPKLNFLRKKIWKLLLKKFCLITCPTKQTYKLLIDNRIVENNKVFILYDPIIYIEEIKLRSNIINKEKDFLLSIGRLTKQKNFIFLVNAFKNPIFFKKKLLIIGDGEDKNKLVNLILKLGISHNIDLLGYKNNVFDYLSSAECFVLSSLWEDPGFVLVEAAYSRTPIISSDCPNGPSEFLDNGNNGYLYKTNNLDDFVLTYSRFINDDYKNIHLKLLRALKSVKNYTLFRHYKNLSKLLN